MPDFSARRMMPSHSAMMPTSGRAIFITAISAMLNAPSVTSFIWPVAAPMSTAHSDQAQPNVIQHGANPIRSALSYARKNMGLADWETARWKQLNADGCGLAAKEVNFLI